MPEWRPGLLDLWVYDKLIQLHESDYSNDSDIPDFIWKDTPDHIMEKILESGRIFDMEYGWDAFDEDVRLYLIENDFIIDPMDNDAVTNKEEK
jgi:hypothetical protein